MFLKQSSYKERCNGAWNTEKKKSQMEAEHSVADYCWLPEVNCTAFKILKKHKLKDITDFLNKLSNLGTLPSNAMLVTLDVSSLYTNIPHNEGIDACRHFLGTRTDKHIPTETLCDLLRMILTMNNFTFNQEHYLQVHGTAMGTKMAPSFANLFLGIFEIDALSNAPFHFHTWWRFLDDVFVIGLKV